MTTDITSAPSKPILKRPPLYHVVIFNDDVSTYQCVIDILVNYFNTNEDDAYRFAVKVDIEGSATAGIYTKDVADTKIALAISDLTEWGFPLQIEPIQCE